MTDLAAPASGAPPAEAHKRSPVDLDKKAHPATLVAFFAFLAAGVMFAGWSLLHDTSRVGEPLALGAFGFLALALLIALGFEFVNGFHDTANAVATVIYTRSLPPLVAVVFSGLLNFTGVMISSGSVAYSIVTLLPVDLILNVGSGAGYAMIFALLIAAIVWNLGTWYFGLPNSSSHALIGSVLGVGLANQLMTAQGGRVASGVEWGQAKDVLTALLVSPIVGFAGAALLLLSLKALVKNKKFYEEPDPDHPPPAWLRGLLILTCGSVSLAHGSNDGQKGMGLIMLILIGVAPTAYALNRTGPQKAAPAFAASTKAAQKVFAAHAQGQPAPSIDDARKTARDALAVHKVDAPQVYAALGTLSGDIAQRVQQFGSIKQTPAAATHNMRNDMYLVDDIVARMVKDKDKAAKAYPNGEAKSLGAYDKTLQAGTRYIPRWVKVVVAIALGLGTMIGWKRIVVTVGERIGKTHMTYAVGASAEVVAALTIGAATLRSLPVSTTHILSSGVAGGMTANGSGLQWGTIRNIALAWILTLPAAITLAGSLYWLLRQLVH